MRVAPCLFGLGLLLFFVWGGTFFFFFLQIQMWLPHFAKQAERPQKPESLEGEGWVQPRVCTAALGRVKTDCTQPEPARMEGGMCVRIAGFARTCNSFNLHNSLECYILLLFHCVDVEAEAQRGGVTRPWPHSQQNVDPKQRAGFSPHPLWLFLTLRYAELFPGLSGNFHASLGPSSMWSCCIFLCALIESEITFLMDCLWAPSPIPDHGFPVGQAPGAFFTRAFPAMGVQAQATPTPGISFLLHKLSAAPASLTVR